MKKILLSLVVLLYVMTSNAAANSVDFYLAKDGKIVIMKNSKQFNVAGQEM